MAKLIKVRFLKSPTCEPYNLAYSIGQIGEVNAEMLALLQSNEMVEVLDSKLKATRESKKKVEKR